MTEITQKVDLQPNCWPRKVPKGTPKTLAAVSPVNMIAMARAFFSGATRSAATTEPIPKKAPCARAATIRPAIATP